MNCQQIDRYIYDYCDGTLSPRLKAILDEHLSTCELCRKKVELTYIENEVLKDDFNIPALSPDFTSKVMSTINTKYSGIPGYSPRSLTLMNRIKFGLKKFNPLIASTAVASVLIIMLLLYDISGQLIAHNQNSADSSLLHSETPTEGIDNGDNLKEFSEDKAELTGSTKKYDSDNSQIEVAGNDTVSYNIQSDSNTPEDEQVLIGAGSGAANASNPERIAFSGKQQKITPEPKAENLALFSLHPENIPSSYELKTISSLTENSISFIYQKNNGESLQIAIVPYQENLYTSAARGSTNMAALTADDLNSTSQKSPAGATSLTSAANGKCYSISWKINGQKQKYLVTITANMSPEDLAQLAAQIEFKEVNN